ncbi:hypothetical protein OIDMADRAFT_61308 [Oidiodendron maius Zn]|uniref:Uncharacterized protein n=1 Tax=Oidiodendron maius (strain Zn) TaxID=913774 RepID=A0A0C3GTG8_OIDMZ|nr:hypothetical protein OIDMADRAFT_61308 [Oidiodendron maius Zn]
MSAQIGEHASNQPRKPEFSTEFHVHFDPDNIKSIPMGACGQTSNRLWLGIRLSHASNETLLGKVVKELRGRGWLGIDTRMVALLCRKKLDIIQGHVLVQTSLAEAYQQGILHHAQLYDQEFKRLEISRSRCCIKIITIGLVVSAARTLQQECIPTLCTEVRTHHDPTLWSNVDDPATPHPFSNRILQMTEVFKHLYKVSGGDQPLVEMAAFRSIKEVIPPQSLATTPRRCHR